jgi:hypothetical protein
VGSAITSVGSFQDTCLFSPMEVSALFSTAVSNNLTNVLGLSDGMVSLYMEAGAVDTALGSFSFTDSTGSISHAFCALSAGDYYYSVSGNGTGAVGGFYTISSLVMAGLGAIGFVARRRKQ